MAVQGHNRANRIEPEPMLRAEFDELEAKYLIGRKGNT